LLKSPFPSFVVFLKVFLGLRKDFPPPSPCAPLYGDNNHPSVGISVSTHFEITPFEHPLAVGMIGTTPSFPPLPYSDINCHAAVGMSLLFDGESNVRAKKRVHPSFLPFLPSPHTLLVVFPVVRLGRVWAFSPPSFSPWALPKLPPYSSPQTLNTALLRAAPTVLL